LKIAITTDWHIDGKTADAIIAQAAAMAAVCKRREVEVVLHAGDMYNRPMIGNESASTGKLLDVANTAIAAFGENVFHLMIPGNHDSSGASQEDALHHFDLIPNVRVARGIQAVNYGGVRVLCVPWSWRGESAEQAMTGVAEEAGGAADILLAHVEVVGARMGGVHTCDPVAGKWQVSRAFLDSLPVRHVALGHFHARQSLCPAGGYVGALTQLNFGDEGNPAGFEIWDSATGSTEWINLDAAPKHHTYIVDEHTPAPTEIPAGVKARIRYVRGMDRVEARRLEAAGATVEEVIEPTERIQRADVRPGVIHDKPGLIRLFAESQNPPIAGERLDRMNGAFEELIADNQAA